MHQVSVARTGRVARPVLAGAIPARALRRTAPLRPQGLSAHLADFFCLRKPSPWVFKFTGPLTVPVPPLMKVAELKEELEAREEGKSGNKRPGSGAGCTAPSCASI